MNKNDKFSCNLAIILARDREVVGVRLVLLSGGCKVYLSKNSAWLENDITYINKIVKHLKNISEKAPVKSSEVEYELTYDIMTYCSAKFKSRLGKLTKDIVSGKDID